MLEITNFTKTYEKSDVKAVDDLTLTVKAGEIFGFLGPNGAGKSTTIKSIVGVLPFEQGDIKINGVSVKENARQAKSCIGYVPDSPVIYEKLTGREYAEFMADIYGVSIEERKERIEKLSQLFKLNDDMDRRILSYSHGMKQKILIIGALIANPKLWILDEPMTGLDPQSAFDLKNLMRAHCKEGNAVFFSSHVLDVVEKLCDRVGIIDHGKLITVCDMNELKAKRQDLSLESLFLSLTGAETHGDIQL